MKNYILIQNDGEIEPNCFELIGASTKRDDNTKIGFFGSGLKYSIAYMMRNNIDFKIYAGETELKFTTTTEYIRGKEFERICINGKETSYTITMGPTWTEDWFVIREIFCNALDESGCQIVRETTHINPIVGKTRIYIESTKSLRNVINNWDAYFSTEREPLFTSHRIYTSYLGEEPRQKVDIYNKTDGVIYRKGIRVGIDENLMYDYGFSSVKINEDRTAKSVSAIGYSIIELLNTFVSESYVANVLRNGIKSSNNKTVEFKAMETTHPQSVSSNKWVEFSNQYLLVVYEKSGKYDKDIMLSSKEVFFIPKYFASFLKSNLPNISILGMGKKIGNTSMSDIETTPKMDYLLKDVISSLNEMKYDIPFDISIVQFDEDDVLGQADIKDKRIYLSSSLFDMGKREIALTLMEETEHILSGEGDETRAFQSHIFSRWLSSLEDNHGLFF